MRYGLIFALVSLIVPMNAHASVLSPASFQVAQSPTIASSSPGNAYVMGTSVVLTAPVAGDFFSSAGSIVTVAPVTGDTLLLAGSIYSRAPVAGDFRAIGGKISIDEPIGGDLFAAAYSVHDAGRAYGSTFIVSANTTLSKGSGGPVTIYGNNISLSGEFAGDVTIYSVGRLSLDPNTVIHGRLSYEAPDVTTIPQSVVIDGGVIYTNASYLPDAGTSRLLAFFSIGLFLIARIIGVVILAGLLAGLFPVFAEVFLGRVYGSRPRTILLSSLLGFATLVATPIVILLLMLTFVGIGIATLLFVLFALLALLATMYAGILLGGVFARYFLQRTVIFWHDGVLGMVALSLIALVPLVGAPLVFFCVLVSMGTLLRIFFRFAFPPHEEDDIGPMA